MQKELAQFCMAETHPIFGAKHSKIVKVESRGKACFDYAETHPIFGAKHSKIVKVESRGKNPD